MTLKTLCVVYCTCAGRITGAVQKLHCNTLVVSGSNALQGKMVVAHTKRSLDWIGARQVCKHLVGVIKHVSVTVNGDRMIEVTSLFSCLLARSCWRVNPCFGFGVIFCMKRNALRRHLFAARNNLLAHALQIFSS